MVKKFFLDLFTNVKGWADLHKIMGYAFAISGLVCAIRPTSPIDVTTFLAIEGVAGALLGISLVSDAQALKSGETPRY